MNVLLVESHILVCESIKFYLQELDPDIRVTIATGIAEAQETASKPDGFDAIVLSDKIFDATRQGGYDRLAGAFPGTPIVVLAQFLNRRDALSLIRAGAAGVIPKHLNAEALILILRLVISGHQYIPSTLLESLNTEGPSPREPDQLAGLTPRQREILKLLVQGLPNKAIAQALDIREITVKAQLTRVFKKFGVSNRTELVSYVMGLDKSADGATAP